MTYHTPPVFEKVGPDGEVLSLKRGGAKAYTDTASNTIFELMQDDPKVAVITAAMCQGNKLEKVRDDFPDRFFDVGICESHAVAFAAGMAKAGMRPIVDIYSTFLQRSFDQIFQEVALQNLPVVFTLDRAGLTGPDGPTHHGAFDIPYMRLFPNMVVMAPGDERDVPPMLRLAVRHNRPRPQSATRRPTWRRSSGRRRRSNLDRPRSTTGARTAASSPMARCSRPASRRPSGCGPRGCTSASSTPASASRWTGT